MNYRDLNDNQNMHDLKKGFNNFLKLVFFLFLVCTLYVIKIISKEEKEVYKFKESTHYNCDTLGLQTEYFKTK